MREVNLDVFHQNKDYQNFINFTSPNKEDLTPFLELLNTNGDAWIKKDDYFPLIISKIMKNHHPLFEYNDPLGNVLDRHFLFRTFVNNSNNEAISDDDFKWAVEMLAEKNPTKALMFTGHENEYVRLAAEAVVKGALEDYSFKVNEVHFGPEDALILDDEAK